MAVSEGAWWTEFALAGGLDELETWLGGVDHPSRVRIRERIAECGYLKVLDCGAGLGLDAIGMKNISYDVEYVGVEPSEAMREAADQIAERYDLEEPNIAAGSIEEIPFEDSSFELVYCRHVLEHLPRIDRALAEMIRVARLEMIVVFFMRPGKEDYLLRERDGLWQNVWSKTRIDEIMVANSKVAVSFYESLGGEVLLHAYLEDAVTVEAELVAERLQ
jgi:ubiquinone/menaquinone biosynthesis C-methylase UbiE